MVQNLQKNPATHCEETVFARLQDREENSDRKLEFLLDQLVEEVIYFETQRCLLVSSKRNHFKTLTYMPNYRKRDCLVNLAVNLMIQIIYEQS